jgi:hypothetical protein
MPPAYHMPGQAYQVRHDDSWTFDEAIRFDISTIEITWKDETLNL